MAEQPIDEFAQTRGADDLFDDEIIPVSAEEQQAQTEVVAPEPEPEPEPAPAPQEEQQPIEKQPPPRGETPQRGRGGERGRGRGRGRGKPAKGLNESRFADPNYVESPPRAKPSTSTPEPEPAPETRDVSPGKSQDGAKEQEGADEEGKNEVLIANGAEPQRVPAVRGDRSATGGVRKVRSHLLSGSLTHSLTLVSLSRNYRKKNSPSESLLPERTPRRKPLLTPAPRPTRPRF